MAYGYDKAVRGALDKVQRDPLRLKFLVAAILDFITKKQFPGLVHAEKNIRKR